MRAGASWIRMGGFEYTQSKEIREGESQKSELMQF